MGASAVLFAFLGISSVLCFSGLSAMSLRTYDLNNYCQQTIYLSCTDDGWGRAGVLQFSHYPTQTCTVNVTIDTSVFSCPLYEYYAIYFNIREFNLDSSDSLIVYESKRFQSSPTLVKSISKSSSSYSSDPKSYGQLKSEMSRTPLLSITLNKLSSYTPSYFPLLALDYNVVHDTYSSSDSYCNALSGYVADDLLCEEGDRVNCPYSYFDTTGSNPVYTKNQGFPEFSFCYVMGTGETVGVVIGSILFLIVITGLVSVCCRRRRAFHRHVAGFSVPVHNTHTAYVIGGQQPYPVQQPVLAGAPPAYGTIYPQPGPAGANVMPQPPNMYQT